MANVLVYGWYGRGNVGDELMARALREMFASHGIELKLVDALRIEDASTAHAVIFGGGCILHDDPIVDSATRALFETGTVPVFYLGIGFETSISPYHTKLLARSHLVATRSKSYPSWVPNVVEVPDLVYSLPQSEPMDAVVGQLLVVPNVETVPVTSDPHWAHVAWERFKDELAQFLDVMLEERAVVPTFLLMCKNAKQDDAWPAHEIIARMRNRSTSFRIVRAQDDPWWLTSFIGCFEAAVIQRYHGIILSQMAGTPCVSIDHHDKLKHAHPRSGVNLSYHGITKAALLHAYETAVASPRDQIRIPRGQYEALARDVAKVVTLQRDHG